MPKDDQSVKLKADATEAEPGSGSKNDSAPPHDAGESRRGAAHGQTGPRTPRGKAVCSRNPTTHGILARDVIVTRGHAPENPADHVDLLAEMHRAYNPQTPLENLLVERVALANWRLRRTQRFEVAAIEDNVAACREAVEQELDEARDEDRGRMERLRNAIGECRTFLKYLQRHPKADPFADDTRFPVGLLLAELAAAAGRACPEGLIKYQTSPGCMKYLHELGLDRADEIRKAVLEALRRIVDRHSATLKELESAEPEDDEGEPPELETATLLGSIPAPDKLKLLIRYERSIREDRDRAVAELNALRRGEREPGPEAE